MVALDESKEINPQARNVNDSSWNTIKQWVKQKSFIYQVHTVSLSDWTLKKLGHSNFAFQHC